MTSTITQTTIDNVERKDKSNDITNHKVSPITAYNDIDVLALPPSAYASPSSTLITNSAFYYDSESNDDDIELSFNCLYIGDMTHYSDNDQHSDSDSIPLIDRITPPPPLFTNNIIITSDDEYKEYPPINHDQKESIYNLSVIIPSLTLSNSTPIHEQKERCSIYEISNNITPITTDNDEEEIQDNKDNKITGKDKQDKSNEKRFDWRIPNDANIYAINDYLMKHIDSLTDDNLSE